MAVTELDLVKLGCFLAAAYITGRATRLLRLSPIIAYIAVGALLGPPLANFAPEPQGLVLAGLLGIQLSVTEAGLGTNIHTLLRLAARALLIAVLGIILPLGGAIGIVVGRDAIGKTFFPKKTFRAAFAAGAAIAPTSLGVTSQLLLEHGELQSDLGLLISVAAIFDDVISLVLLAEVQAAAEANIFAWNLIQPLVFSLVFIIGFSLLSFFLPKAICKVLPKLPVTENIKPQLGLFLILSLSIASTYVAILAKTSFLLAAYLSGVAFADTEEEKFSTPWKTHVSPQISWLALLFFAATIGFVIPLRNLFQPSTLGLGLLMAVASTFGKLLCGLGALPKVTDAVSVGVAMLGRGEFGFLIAATARKSGLIDDQLYAATIWGVLVPTILTPVVFGFVFRWRSKHQNQDFDTASAQA